MSTEAEFKKPLGKPIKQSELKVQKKKSAVKVRELDSAPVEIPELEGESESESDFSLEDSASDVSDSTESSSDLSSSSTDDFAAGTLRIELDKNTKEKMHKEIQEQKTPVTEIKSTSPRGVVYLGHIPYGFHERPMKQFFSQFGTVTRLRLSRNKKTGNPKHYAFIEFLDPVVAKIVADTMDNYIMYHRMLVCKVVPPEKVHPKMFKGQKRAFLDPANNINRYSRRHNQPMTEERKQKILNRQAAKERRKKKKLEQMGIDYDFVGYSSLKLDSKSNTEQIAKNSTDNPVENLATKSKSENSDRKRKNTKPEQIPSNKKQKLDNTQAKQL